MEDKLRALRRLQEIIERLRAPGGCPWDREQTLPSLAKNFLEEACEVIDAIETSADAARSPAVLEELGDLLMNIFLAARVAEETGAFDLTAVAEAIADKLVRRHPHVFGDVAAGSVDDVLERWQAIKASEERLDGRTAAADSVLARVPRSLPPLELAYEYGKKAARIGFDWETADDAFAKVREEVDEVAACLSGDRGARRKDLEHEVGDLLLAVVNFSRKLDLAPDTMLRQAAERFRRRFRKVEDLVGERRARGQPAPSLEEMEERWQQAKRNE